MENVIYLENHKSDFWQILDPQGTRYYSSSTYKNFRLLIFGHHLEFWQKWKMSFISKTIRDRAISGKFCTQRVLGNTPVAPLENLDFSDFRPLKFCQKWKMPFISKTVRDGAIPGKFWTPRVPSTNPLAPRKNLNFSDFRLPS